MSSRSIEREIEIEAPIDLVWKTLTDPVEISRWFSEEAEIDLRPGGRGALVFGERATNEAAAQERMTVQLIVESVEPPERFAFRWAHPEGTEARVGNSLRVEFTLVADGDATRLRMVESGFDELERSEQERIAYVESHDTGWDIHLGRLREHASRKSEPSRP